MWEGAIPDYLKPFFEELANLAGIARHKQRREFNREAAMKGLAK